MYRHRPYIHHKNQFKLGHTPKCQALEDNIGENLDELVYGNEFLDTIPNAHLQKEELISWTLLNLKTSALVSRTMRRQVSVKRMRSQTTDCEEIFAKDTLD